MKKVHCKFIGFEYTQVGEISRFSVFGITAYKKVGDIRVIFGRFQIT